MSIILPCSSGQSERILVFRRIVFRSGSIWGAALWRSRLHLPAQCIGLPKGKTGQNISLLRACRIHALFFLQQLRLWPSGGIIRLDEKPVSRHGPILGTVVARYTP